MPKQSIPGRLSPPTQPGYEATTIPGMRIYLRAGAKFGPLDYTLFSSEGSCLECWFADLEGVPWVLWNPPFEGLAAFAYA